MVKTGGWFANVRPMYVAPQNSIRLAVVSRGEQNICTEYQLHQRCGADIINTINQKRLHIIIMSANNEVISHVFDANLVKYHGLHGSTGTVLMAITLSYGKWRNSTPQRIKIPSLVVMKL